MSDPSDAEDVPYERKQGQRVARVGARLVQLEAREVLALRMVAPYLTLDNLADEVRERRERIAELERRKKACEYGSKAWFDAQFLLLEDHRRLQVLLERYGFEPAARRLDKAVERLERAASDDPRWSRGREALDSFRERTTPASLEAAAEKISEGKDRFAVHASQHLLLVHDQRIDEGRARRLLTFGEEVIEGFRREFIDPHGCTDLIPDRPFAEFWFGPDEDEKFERYLEDYYRLSWGTEEERRHSLRFYGHYPTRGSPPEFLSYCRNPERDLLGLLAHRLGENLATLHFEAFLRDGYNLGFRQDWLEETLGVYLSLEYVGASTTQCTALLDDTVGRAAPQRHRERGERPADYYRYLSAFARPLDLLVLKRTGELGTADIAKGWCLLRFLARTDGERGQEVLHSVSRLSRERGRFLVDWREELRWFYSVSEGDPIQALESLALAPVKR